MQRESRLAVRAPWFPAAGSVGGAGRRVLQAVPPSNHAGSEGAAPFTARATPTIGESPLLADGAPVPDDGAMDDMGNAPARTTSGGTTDEQE